MMCDSDFSSFIFFLQLHSRVLMVLLKLNHVLSYGSTKCVNQSDLFQKFLWKPFNTRKMLTQDMLDMTESLRAHLSHDSFARHWFPSWTGLLVAKTCITAICYIFTNTVCNPDCECDRTCPSVFTNAAAWIKFSVHKCLFLIPHA